MRQRMRLLLLLCACLGLRSVGKAAQTEAGAEEECSIDFEALLEENPDICAWLELPGLELSEPVVFREEDNAYYLLRDYLGEPSSNGSFFIEDYNEPDFTDPVTVIYGHNMRSGEMFGALQENYSNEEFFEEYKSFTVYTPNETLEYEIFAAIPYSNLHILYYHDFSEFSVLEEFLQEIVEIRSLIAVVDEAVVVEEGDRIVILSTCQDGDNTQRYLVLGVYKEEKEEETEEITE